MGWEDDIHLGDDDLGNFSEIGESLRGMQDARVGAAQRQLRQLRGTLGSLAQNRFASHAPVSKQMRSPYKDSTQIGILVSTGDILPPVWEGSSLPQFAGTTRVYKSFKPTKAILTELLTVVFTNGETEVTRVTSVSDSADLVLVSAFSGADNCFPNAPSESTGIAGQTFANNSLGNGISWPTINGGIDMTVAFAIESSAQFQITPPVGFPTVARVSLRIRFNLLGPSLR